MDMDKRYLSVIKACALSLLLVGVGGLSSCNSDDIKEDAMYTFTERLWLHFVRRLQSCPSFIN